MKWFGCILAGGLAVFFLDLGIIPAVLIGAGCGFLGAYLQRK